MYIPNVCFKKIWTNYSSVSLLQHVQIFLKQTLSEKKIFCHPILRRINKITVRQLILCMHGGSDSTAIKRRQQQLGRMADFLPSVTFSVFDLYDYEAPHIKSQTMRHPLMNLVNTTLSQKYGDP